MKVLITSPKGKERLIGAFLETGCEVVKELTEDVKLIIPAMDEELHLLSTMRDYFKTKGIVVSVASEFTINTCRDKAEFGLFCGRHGFNTPRTRQLGGSV